MSVHESNELSLREQEILKLVATGASNKEIAQKLVISPNTVKVHLRNIFTKIGTASRTEAAMFAVKNGLVEAMILPDSSTSLPVSENNFTKRETLVNWIRRDRVVIVLGLLLMLSLAIVLQLINFQSGINEERPQPTTVEETRWKQLPDMPTARASLAGVAIGNVIYAIGGEGQDGVSGLVEVFDVTSNKWHTVNPLTIPVYNIEAALIGGKIYIPGGLTSEEKPTNRLQIYEPTTGHWSFGASIPVPLSGYALATFEGQLFIFGGWDGKNYSRSVYTYNPTENIWLNSPPLKKPRSGMGVAATGDKFFIIGGWDGDEIFDDIEVYKMSPGSSGSILIDENLLVPEPRYGVKAVTLLDNIYVLGGKRYPNADISIFGYHLLQSNNQWGEIRIIPEGYREDSAITVMGNNIMVLGGRMNGILTNTAYSYQAINIVFIPLTK